VKPIVPRRIRSQPVLSPSGILSASAFSAKFAPATSVAVPPDLNAAQGCRVLVRPAHDQQTGKIARVLNPSFTPSASFSLPDGLRPCASEILSYVRVREDPAITASPRRIARAHPFWRPKHKTVQLSCLALTPLVMIGAPPLDRREHSADPPNESDFLGLGKATGIFRSPQIEEEGAKIMSAAVSTVPAQFMKITSNCPGSPPKWALRFS
jgi:hypothetical protein